MNAKRLFEDDDVVFPFPANDDDRVSQVELRFDPATMRETRAPAEYLARVPMLAVSPRELPLLPLDHREGFLVACIDGVSSIEALLDVCAMPAEEALTILEQLVARGVVVVR